MDTGAKLTGYLTYVGGKDYYDGTATAVSGIRLIDDYTFSVTILAEKIPYYYDLRLHPAASRSPSSTGWATALS